MKLALIIAVMLTACPTCGNHDAVIMTDGNIKIVHMAEDAIEGDIYQMDGDELGKYLGYIY